MQYYRPDTEGLFVGDCMPWYHQGTFYLYYLLDEGHHRALDGLGGHQWALATSTDLVSWRHRGLVLPRTEDWEGSICTGSPFWWDGTFYAFYATRLPDRTQHLSVATSTDGICFEKRQPNPFMPAPAGYDPHHFRDPVVFRAEDRFHMLVTAWQTDGPVPERGGCLAHLTSDDLRRWQVEPPFYSPGLPGAPECPDWFTWNSWYYLVYSNGGVARYRRSRAPLGPWERPAVDTFDGPFARVMKTAAFGSGRRLGAAWLGTRRDGQDQGPYQFGGNLVLRELVQAEDGALWTGFPPELTPRGRPIGGPTFSRCTPGVRVAANQVEMPLAPGLQLAGAAGLPPDLRLRATVRATAGEVGIRFRAGASFGSGYALRLLPGERRVELASAAIGAVDALDGALSIELVLRGDILDACLGGRRCVIDRAAEQRGDRLYLYCQDGAVTFEAFTVESLTGPR
ncbi:MAG: family 43 glycosylhydrolase [Gemmatimonadota bacterium]